MNMFAANKKYNVLAFGNALVDVLCQVQDDFLVKHDIPKGSMMLIDAVQADNLYNQMGQTRQVSGGSAANSVAVMANLGAKTAFIGAVADDEIGKVFAHDMTGIGVDFYGFVHQRTTESSVPTGRCHILVSPDAQRTMCTHLGVAGNIPIAALDEHLISDASLVYVEGYLWDQAGTKESIRHALKYAQKVGTKTALTFSDVFCVAGHRDEFKELISSQVDIVFANEAEIMTFFEVSKFDDALQAMRQYTNLFAITRGEKGAVIVHQDVVHIVDGIAPEKLLDTTGAGDAFAAGFMYGLTHGLSYVNSAELGCSCASKIISHFGARPETSLANLVRAA